MKGLIDQRVFNAMAEGKPYRSYIKSVPSKVYITFLSPFSGEPEGRILSGDPKGKDREDCIVDTWNEMEDNFFRRANHRHLETRYVVPYQRPTTVVEKTVNELTDEELKSLLSTKFLALQNKVNKMDSVAPIFRLLEFAKELEKSEKIIHFLEAKISELQEKEYGLDSEEEE